jgi:hypothetical protein
MGEYNDDALTDGPEPGRGPEQPSDDEAPEAQGPKRGPLLDLPEAAAAKKAWKLFKDQDPAMQQRIARWDVNARRRRGDPWSRIVKDQDTGTARVYSPPGAANTTPALLKTGRLARKFTYTLFSDPPKPNVEPTSGQDEDRDAAELSERILLDLGGESGINVTKTARRAVGKACSYASAFVHVYVDPAGGQRPKRIRAHPDAETVGDAVFQTVPDPQTQAPMRIARDVPEGGYPPRYVMPREPDQPQEAARLTDDPREAEQEWVPRLCRTIYSGKNVRLLPDTADGIESADGVQIADFLALGVLKGMFPRIDAMTPDEQWALTKVKPERVNDFLPKHAADRRRTASSGSAAGQTEQKGPPDDALVFVLMTWYRGPTPTYPKGAYVVTAGDKFRLYGEAWCAETTGPDGKPTEECLDLPVAQFRQFEDDDEDDPYGFGLIDFIGSGDEVRATQFGNLIEHLYRFNNPHIFVPNGSSLSAKQLSVRRGTPIFVNPGGEPKYEEVPQYPQQSIDLLDRATDEMNDESGLEEAAQGVATPSVQSGRHADAIIQQALVALSGPRQNIEDAIVRLWRLILQTARARFTTPQLLKYKGEDGDYIVTEWSAADLRSTKDVRMAPGSFTMMNPDLKAQYTMQIAQPAGLTPDEVKRLTVGNVRAIIGLQDDPNVLRVRRSISQWEKGPPAGWQPPAPAMPAAPAPAPMPMEGPGTQAGGGGQGPATPAPAGPPAPPPPDPVWDPRPSDEEQAVALLRFGELSRAMAGGKYGKQPPAWRQVFDAEYARMGAAAGVQSVADQQRAAQAAAQQQADQAAQQEAAKQQAAQATAQQQQQFELEKLQQQSALEGQRAAAQQASLPPAPPPGPDPSQLIAEAVAQTSQAMLQVLPAIAAAVKPDPAPPPAITIMLPTNPKPGPVRMDHADGSSSVITPLDAGGA